MPYPGAFDGPIGIVKVVVTFIIAILVIRLAVQIGMGALLQAYGVPKRQAKAIADLCGLLLYGILGVAFVTRALPRLLGS